MKMVFKKAVSVLLVAIMVLSAVPLSRLVELDLQGLKKLFSIEAKATQTKYKEGYYTYIIDESGMVTITKCEKYASGDVIIPSQINGITVRSIGTQAFYECSKITSVVIPNSITEIGSNAFRRCTNLENIQIGDSVEKLGVAAFDDTSYYNNSVNWESGLLYVNNYLIGNDDKIEICNVKEGTKIISESFFSCTKLTKVIIPSSVVRIEECEDAFYNCNNLVEIVVDSKNKNYSSDDHGVLFDKNKSTLIKYPEGNSRTVYQIPEGVKSIGENAFNGCEYVVNIIIPQSVERIGAYAFNYCYSLGNIKVNKDNSNYSNDEHGVLFNKTKTTLIQYPIGNERNSYCVPNSVNLISNHAFASCTNLTDVIISSNLKSIGEGAFNGCKNIKKFTIPNGCQLENIGTSAFWYCRKLTEFIVPNRVNEIKSDAFGCCDGLEYVHIPSGVNLIGERILQNSNAYICSASEDCYAKEYAEANGYEFRLCDGSHAIEGGEITPPAEDDYSTQNIKVMSYNVYVYDQGEYSYRNRAKYISNNILENMPDSVGLQEVTEEFWQKIKTVSDVSNRKVESYYDVVGEYRNGDKTDGGNNEGSLILYNKNKYELLDTDTFWLSETPDEVSFGWKANEYRRICTYAVLKNKETNSIYAHFNTHLDHDEYTAINSVKLITDYIREHYPNIPIVFTGDFNHKEQTNVYQIINNGGFLDSKTETSLFDVGNTYHDYGRGNENKIIDFIFTNDFVTKVKSCEVYDKDYSNEGLEIKYASDHHPIISELSFEHNTVLIKKCTYCGETFSDKDALKLHIMGGLCSSYIDEGKDNFSFTNAEGQGGFDGINYSISDEYKDILLSKYNFAARKNINDFIASKWGGSCLGMSCVTALIKAQKLDPQFFDPYALNAYSLTAPYYSDTTESLVNFYHVQQLVKPLSKAREFNSNESVNLKKLVDSVTESKFPVVIGFDIREVVGGARYGGHSVVAYGIEQDGDYYKIYISDPNKDCYFLFIKTDYSDAYFTGNTGTKGSYYWDNEDTYDSFITWSIKVEDSSESYNHINIQEELLKNEYSSGNIELMSYEEETDSFMINVNYQDFVINCSDGTYANVENGDVTSGTLVIKYFGAQNEVGTELELMYSLPALDSGETYTISPISEIEKLNYTSSVLCDSDISFFISATTNERADIVVSSDGSIRTNCVSETEQTITVSRSDASTKWYSISVNGTAKSFNFNQTSSNVKISSDNLNSAELTVSNDFNTVTFDNITLSSSPIKIYDTANGVTYITNDNGEVIDSANIGNAVIFYSLGGTTVDALCNLPCGERISEPIAPTRCGYLFDGWYTGTEFLENQKWNFDTDRVSEDTRLYAKWIDISNCNIIIKNNSGSSIINYGETLRLTANIDNKPLNTKICWFINGEMKYEGETFDVSFESGTKTVEVKLVDVNGNVLKDASGNEFLDSESVTVRSGFFQKIISFFKNLFRMNRTVVQAIFKGTI